MNIIEDKSKPLLLMDMDNTGTGFEPAFEKRMREIVPPEIIAQSNPDGYWVEDIFAHAEEYHEALNNIFLEKGFFLNMEPLSGFIEAIYEMINEGFAVRFCTTPSPESEFCYLEKNEWIRKYFGEEFVLRAIYTYDKTIIYGDILIDDKPIIEGFMNHEGRKPFWTHVLFDHRHNKKVDTPYRLKHWNDWRKVIYPILKGLGK